MEEPLTDNPLPLEPKYKGLDALLHRVGAENRYQIISFVIFSMQWFCMGWVLTGGDFFFMDATFVCADSVGEQCQKYVCSLHEDQWRSYLDPSLPKTATTAFSTIYACNKEAVLTTVKSMIFVGSFIGFFLFPHIADNKGRKIAIVLSWGCATLGVILVAAGQNLAMVAAGWFITGFGGNPAITLSYSFINEQSLGKSRQYFSIGIQLLFAVGESLVGLLFKQVMDWRILAYVLVGFFGITGITQLYLVETPKFMSKRDKQATLEIYNGIARKNNKPQITMEDLEAALMEEPVEVSSTASVLDLFKYKSLLLPNLICGFVFLAIQLQYYCTSFNLASVGYSMYFNQQFIGIAEFFGYLSAEILIPRVKRKMYSFIGMGGSSILCFALISVEGGKNKIVSLILLCIMRMLLCSFWATFYVYLGELFPTKVRSLAFGWSSAMGTVGSALAPHVIYFSKNKFRISSWIIPGAVGIMATATLFPLRQTLNRKLQDDIQETKPLLRNSQITSSGIQS